MKRQLGHSMYVLLSLVVAIAAALFVAQPASAQTIVNTVDNNTPLRGCPTTGCPAVGNLVAGGSRVADFCKIGVSDLIYTGRADGRGGFVSRGALFVESQPDNCDAVGQAGVTNRSVTLRACASNNCSAMGTAAASGTVGMFCSLIGQVIENNATWVLIYADAANRGGFVPRVAVNGIGTPGSCNSGL